MGRRARESPATAAVGAHVICPRTHAALALVVLSTFAASSARAEEPKTPSPAPAPARPWVPTVSLGMGSFDERLRVRVDGSDYDSYRSQLRMFLALGVSHPIMHLRDERFWLDGHGSIGLGPTFQTGHWQVPIREDVTFAYAATHWLTLRAGLGFGVTVDATESCRSFAEIGIPISLTLSRAFELVYRPMLSMPLGSESSPVFGGDRELSTRLAVLPFEVTLRARIGALAW